MSMSTGDVRRPSANKLSTKATATGSPKDDVIDTDTPEEATEATTEATSGLKPEPSSQSRPGARSAAKATTRTARPGAKAPGAKATGAKVTEAKAAGAAGGKVAGPRTPGARIPAARPPAKAAGGGKGRKPVKTVKVSQGRNWGPIWMFTGAGLLAVLIVGFGAFQLIKKANQPSWQERAADIEGIHNYLVSNPDWFKVPAEGNHKAGVLSYPTSPPVGGVHNPYWQNCMGDVYAAEIPKEQATHSMEHGAVWVTYNPSLPKDQVDELAKKVNGKTFMLMSPYPGLDKAISLQAWGYQLKVDNADDSRIDDFIGALRQNTTQEPQAGCSSGITDTGKEPLNLTPPSNTGTGTGTGG
jgi:hypothetical protein